MTLGNQEDYLEPAPSFKAYLFQRRTPKEKVSIINRSRNWVRYKFSLKGIHKICLIKEYKAFTTDELYLIENYNLLQQQIWELENSPELKSLKQSLANVRVAFFTKFYDNCPKVGSTLKPTKKSKLHPEKSHLPF